MDAPLETIEPMVDAETLKKQKTLEELMLELQKYPLMQTSPMEAMNQIAKWKSLVEN
jgi:DNA mismatch repair protein MutS